MKSIIALVVMGLLCAAMTGCESHDTKEKTTTVKYDNGGATVKTTTVEKK